MASLSSPHLYACDLKKILMTYQGRRSGGNWAMVFHVKQNLFSFLIVAALFTSAVDGQFGSIAIPPAQRYLQAVSSPPAPQAFSMPFSTQRQNRRELEAPSSAPRNETSSFMPYVSSSTTPNGSFSTTENGKGKMPIGIIVGSVVGAIAVIGLIAAAVVWKYKKKPAKGDVEQPGGHVEQETPMRSPKDGHAFLPVKGTAMAYAMEVVEVPAESGNETAVERTTSAAKESGRHAASEGSSPRPTDRMALVATATRYFTYNEILSITRNFSQVIGEGGSSTVYYGQLPEGLKVAVKKLKESGSLIGNLLSEIKILTRIHHKNLVSLVGLCEEQDEIILVSEYMASGSLSEILKDRNKELTWRKRLQIALDAATGLEYLHTGCSPAVIHRDIKPANILLDENLQAKLADFGLSKAGAVDGTEHTAYQTKVAGTMGYIDPEYLYTQTLTKKSDVYSFGVVLFELMTGKPAIVITETNEKCNLTRWVMPMLMRGNIESLLDPLLKGRCNIPSVWEVAAIAKTAIQDPAGRPDMPQIVSTLKAALNLETSWVDMASVSEMTTSESSFVEIPHNPVAR